MVSAKSRKAQPPSDELTAAQQRELYYWMKLNRLFDERVASLYRRGKVPGALTVKWTKSTSANEGASLVMSGATIRSTPARCRSPMPYRSHARV